jgi:hypothetical protein
MSQLFPPIDLVVPKILVAGSRGFTSAIAQGWIATSHEQDVDSVWSFETDKGNVFPQDGYQEGPGESEIVTWTPAATETTILKCRLTITEPSYILEGEIKSIFTGL